jgi:5-methylcytosine-specific restriction protein A
MPKSRQPKEIWQVTRLRVLERDGYCCVRCQVPLGIDTAQVDHIQSGKRGDNRMSNLRTLCRRCHVLRADHRHRGMTAKAIADGIIPPDWRSLVWKG